MRDRHPPCFNSLQLCLSTDVSMVEYTFIGALGTRSLIDHFIVTVGLAEYVSCYKQLRVGT